MRYARLQRREYESFITIGEYLLETTPDVFEKLLKLKYMASVIEHMDYDYCNLVVEETIKTFARIMTERPTPGRGGLLPGESEEVLYG